MPIFEVTVRGEKSSHIVKASSAAKARSHIAEAKAVNAERLADLIADGKTIETADEAAGDEAETVTAAPGAA